MTKNETKRKTTWMAQCGKCAICLEHQETAKGMCFAQDKLVCRKCSASLSNYKSALARGVTPEMLVAFLVQPSESIDEEELPERLMIGGAVCEVIGVGSNESTAGMNE